MIDACCLIDLLASGQAEAILRATGHAWHLPTVGSGRGPVRSAARPGQPGSYHNVPVDLTPLIDVRSADACQPDDAQEQARFVHTPRLFRSDGEAMCLALAECRGWIVATDDRKAIRVARQAGLTVVSCPELVKAWADATRPDPRALVQVLTDIQTLAQFRPNPTMPESAWWFKRLSSSGV